MSIFSLQAIKKYIFSLLISVMVTLVLLGVASVIFSFFPPPSWLMYGFSRYTVYFTAFLCAFLSAKSATGQGIFIGILSAALCLLILSATGSLLFGKNEFPISFLRLLPIGIPCGGVGGIIGINSK